MPTSSCALFRAANLNLLDYPYRAALQSALNICDETVIVVGPSSDDTLDALYEQQRFHGKDRVKISTATWDYDRQWQEAVWRWGAGLTKAEWLMYHDFDEAFHENQVDELKSHLDDPRVLAIKFPYIHLYGGSHYRECRDFYKYNTRLGRRSANYRMVNLCSDKTPNHAVCAMLIDIGGDTLDAHTLTGDGVAFAPSPMYHYGWVRSPEALGRSQALHRHWYADGGGTADEVIASALPYDYNMDKMMADGRLCAYEGPHPICMTTSQWWWEHEIEWGLREAELEATL